MRVAIVVGTRPEIVKMSPVVGECEKRSVDYVLVHSNQHYSYEIDRVFFEELGLREPDYNLGVGSGSHAEQTGRMLAGMENVFVREKPDIVLVEGDTNTVLAGALAATKLHIMVGHVEAGLRSYDRTMPEEVNRVLTDHMSDFLFAPTLKAGNILLGEGIAREDIFVTGNTIVDAVRQNLRMVGGRGSILEKLGLRKGGYFLLTAHRQENVDDATKLEGIFEGLNLVHKKFGLPIVYPIHPRTGKMIARFRMKMPDGLRLISPVGFLDFLQLEGNARLVLTDSGGVQEESCILKVPCVTLRENTERPETIDVGGNVLAGTNPKRIVACTRKMMGARRSWGNPFGDGKAAERIMDALL